MLIPLVMLLSAAQADVVASDTVRAPSVFVAVARVPQDTVRRRARAIEVSEWYHRRLIIHKTLSYAAIPVLATQYYLGSKLYDGGETEGTRTFHRVNAGVVGGIFAVNTVTGLWNLWDSRHVEENRWLRTSHALSMLAADGMFAYAGLKLGDQAGVDADKRRQHRTVAISAVAVTAVSGVAMKILNK